MARLDYYHSWQKKVQFLLMHEEESNPWKRNSIPSTFPQIALPVSCVDLMYWACYCFPLFHREGRVYLPPREPYTQGNPGKWSGYGATGTSKANRRDGHRASPRAPARARGRCCSRIRRKMMKRGTRKETGKRKMSMVGSCCCWS